MLSIDWTFVWYAVNLIILYLFMKKFLFGRVGDFMDKRAKGIEGDLDSAQAAHKEAEGLLDDQRRQLEAVGDERRLLLERARKTSVKEADDIVAAARAEAARILETARADGERERAQLLGQIRGEIADLAVRAASKIIEENMDTERNRDIVKSLLDKEAAA